MAFFHDDGRFINNNKMDVRFQLYKSVCDEYSKVELYRSFNINDKEWSKHELDERTTLGDDLSWSKPKLIYESYSGNKKKGDTSTIYKTVSNDGGKTWSFMKRL